MKIVLAGQFDRVYANALARSAQRQDHIPDTPANEAQPEKDMRLFQRAGTLAALSSTVVTAPDWYPFEDRVEESQSALLRKDLNFVPGMALPREALAELYDDAVGLVKAVDFLGSYSKWSLATLDDLSAPHAWIDDDSPRSLQRARMGASHAYLTELLLQPFLAWVSGAVLVISGADCHLLADIATFLVEGGRPRPFPIPDLREIGRLDNASVPGRVVNLGLEDVSDIGKARRELRVQGYAQRLKSIFEAPDLIGVGERLELAMAAAPPPEAPPRYGDNDIRVVVEDAEILRNSNVRVAPHNKALVRWARRQFAPQRLRTIVLA